MTKKARTVEDIVRNGGTLKELGLTYQEAPLLPITAWLSGYYGKNLVNVIKWMNATDSEIVMEVHDYHIHRLILDNDYINPTIFELVKVAPSGPTINFQVSPTFWGIRAEHIHNLIEEMTNSKSGSLAEAKKEMALFLANPVRYLVGEGEKQNTTGINFRVLSYLQEHYSDSGEEYQEQYRVVTKNQIKAMEKIFDTLRKKYDISRLPKKEIFAAFIAENLVEIARAETHKALGLAYSLPSAQDILAKAASSFGDQAEFRASDRLAAANPKWAALNYPLQFKLGVELAPLYTRILQRLQEIHQEEDYGPIVVLGRDGEMIYQIARVAAPSLFKHMIYIIIPRALTTSLKTSHITRMSKYIAQLKRRIPHDAIFVDTGLEGSIPKFLMKKGLRIKRVALVASSNEEFQMFPDEQENRLAGNLVIAKLEHVPQRLAPVKQPEVWNYSKDAPGFWARYYGILHGMGLPIEPPKATNPYD